MNNFDTLGLPQPLLHALKKLNFTQPTPIQTLAIPVALTGRDILGSAQTGTGKTAAYAIPLLTHLAKAPQGKALVMTPTRELAVQVVQALQSMMDRSSPLRTALLIGGESINKQFNQLKGQPRIIVGTPGRINDHLVRGTLKLGDTAFLVLDETDRMLDMGFGPQIDRIIKHLPRPRQTLMFSATLPEHIVKLSAKYLHNPERLAVGSVSAPVLRIRQDIARTSVEGKYGVLAQELHDRDGSVIIFVRTKHGADRLARKLEKDNHSVAAIHGDHKQSKRDRVIREFRNKKNRILVATDVAARGLDIPHIEHVINYDLPQCPEDYIHRIGRTARAGAEGSAVCLLTPDDGAKWAAIQRLINPGEKPAGGSAGRGEKSPYANASAKPGNRRRGRSYNKSARFGGERAQNGSRRYAA